MWCCGRGCHRHSAPPLFIPARFRSFGDVSAGIRQACCTGHHYPNAIDHAELIGPTRNHLSRHTPDSRWLWAIIAPAGAFDKVNRAPRAANSHALAARFNCDANPNTRARRGSPCRRIPAQSMTATASPCVKPHSKFCRRPAVSRRDNAAMGPNSASPSPRPRRDSYGPERRDARGLFVRLFLPG